MASNSEIRWFSFSPLLFLFLTTFTNPSCALPAGGEEKNGFESVIGLQGISGVNSDVRSSYSINTKVNGKPFDLMIDTGHSVTWLAHKDCDTCKGLGVPTIDITLPEACKTDKAQKAVFGWEGWDYVTGCYVDVSLELGNSKLDKFPILMVYDVGLTTGGLIRMSDPKYSGYLGLAGYNDTSEGNRMTPIKAMKVEGLIDSEEVGLYMPYNETVGDGAVGKMIIGDPAQVGEVNKDKKVDMPNVATDHNIFDIHVDQIKINDKIVCKDFTARFDSSYKEIVYPANLEENLRFEIYGKTEDDSSGNVPCKDIASVSFVIGGKEFKIDQKDMTFRTDGWGLCTPSIQENNIDYNSKLWHFGTTFSHNVYTSFNIENGTVKIYGLT